MGIGGALAEKKGSGGGGGDEMGKGVCVKTTKCIIDVYKTAKQTTAFKRQAKQCQVEKPVYGRILLKRTGNPEVTDPNIRALHQSRVL